MSTYFFMYKELRISIDDENEEKKGSRRNKNLKFVS